MARQLEWIDCGDTHYASTPFGNFKITKEDHIRWGRYFDDLPLDPLHMTVETAKKAAQKDFDKWVKECL